MQDKTLCQCVCTAPQSKAETGREQLCCSGDVTAGSRPIGTQPEKQSEEEASGPQFPNRRLLDLLQTT